jgi:hypothetical protein
VRGGEPHRGGPSAAGGQDGVDLVVATAASWARTRADRVAVEQEVVEAELGHLATHPSTCQGQLRLRAAAEHDPAVRWQVFEQLVEDVPRRGVGHLVDVVEHQRDRSVLTEVVDQGVASCRAVGAAPT